MCKRSFDIDSAVSLGASANGTAVAVDETNSFCIAAVISGASSPVGTLKLQASVARADKAADVPSTSWSDVTGSSVAISDNGVTTYDIADKNWRWVRTVYTRTSGSATMTTTFNEND